MAATLQPVRHHLLRPLCVAGGSRLQLLLAADDLLLLLLLMLQQLLAASRLLQLLAELLLLLLLQLLLRQKMLAELLEHGEGELHVGRAGARRVHRQPDEAGVADRRRCHVDPSVCINPLVELLGERVRALDTDRG